MRSAFEKHLQYVDEHKVPSSPLGPPWRLDLATAVPGWLEGDGKGKLVTFGALTAQLELDIAQAAQFRVNV